MRIEELDCAMEEKLYKRLLAFSDMVTRTKRIQDVMINVHGKTGTGKTNTALVLAFVLSKLTGRKIEMFFRTSMAMEHLKNTRDRLVIIDEPSLDLLSTDQITKNGKDYSRLLNTMRQKRHIIIGCITRFWRFPFDAVVDRPLAMINMFDRDGKDPGRFHYIRQNNLERLWDDYQKSKKKNFGKYKAFGGRIVERMESYNKEGVRYFDMMDVSINGQEHCTYEDYKRLRDQEVSGIGESETLSKAEIRANNQLKLFQHRLAKAIKELGISDIDMANKLGISTRTIREWRGSSENRPELLGNVGFEASGGGNIIIPMAKPPILPAHAP